MVSTQLFKYWFRARAAKNMEHRYYKSSQQNDEVILIKCFDTKTDRARGKI